MIKEPLVSIITPVYNTEKFLVECLDSVQNQSYKNWEHILINDKSKDSSLKILKSFKLNDERIFIINNSNNLGAGLSRNKGIKIARGKYITFLDSDDIWHQDKLKIQINKMEKNKWFFSHTSYGYLSESGKKIKSFLKLSRKPITYIDLLKKTEISCLTATYNQQEIGKYYMSEHRLKQDYALWLSILKNNIISYPIHDVLAYYRQRKKSSTNKKYKLFFKHIIFLKETQNFNWLKSIYYTLFWAINGVIRYYIK